jgi:DnaD/phage-associated family protein
MLWHKTVADQLLRPETTRLAELLGVRDFVALGVRSALWQLALSHARDGDITQIAPRVLARYIDWDPVDGTPERLLEALVKSGNVDITDDGRVLVHGWTRWQSEKITLQDGVEAAEAKAPPEEAVPADVRQLTLEGTPAAPTESYEERTRRLNCERKQRQRDREKAAREQITGQQDLGGTIFVGQKAPRFPALDVPEGAGHATSAVSRDMSRDAGGLSRDTASLSRDTDGAYKERARKSQSLEKISRKISQTVRPSGRLTRAGPETVDAGRLEEIEAVFQDLVSWHGLDANESQQINKASVRRWMDMGFDFDVLSYAYEVAIDEDAKCLSAYVNTVLTGWKNAGIRDADAAKAYYEKRKGLGLYRTG